MKLRKSILLAMLLMLAVSAASAAKFPAEATQPSASILL